MFESIIDLPSIYRETACGETRRSIVDDMFADRELVCVGNIDRELVNALILQIRCLEKQDPHAGIAIFINSPGGEVSSGLALYDVMPAAADDVKRPEAKERRSLTDEQVMHFYVRKAGHFTEYFVLTRRLDPRRVKPAFRDDCHEISVQLVSFCRSAFGIHQLTQVARIHHHDVKT